MPPKPPMPQEKISAQLARAADVEGRLVKILNDSGEFWVETQEIDGGTDVRLAVSDRINGGTWITLIAETGEPEED